MMYATQVLLFIAAIASGAQGLGINCRGSSECAFSGAHLNDIQTALKNKFDDVNISDTEKAVTFSSGQQLACAKLVINGGGICAFFQSGVSGTLFDAIIGVGQLLDHGCGLCGSNPTQPGNDVSKGQLTINFTSKPCCNDADPCVCTPGQQIGDVEGVDPGDTESPFGAGNGKKVRRGRMETI